MNTLHKSDEVARPIHARDVKTNKRHLYENTQNNKTEENRENSELSDFDLGRPEVIREPMKVVPRYGGKLKMFKT
jgi:hypothetical protein